MLLLYIYVFKENNESLVSKHIDIQQQNILQMLISLEHQPSSHLHLVFEGVGVRVGPRASLQFTQDHTVLEEEHLSLLPSGGSLHLR